MRIAYFDCISGISGDMILGALLHAGLPLGELEARLSTLGLGPVTLEQESVKRNAIAGIKVHVPVPEREPARHLRDIEQLIEQSELNDRCKEQGKQIFRRLAEAEAAVHATTVDRVHFHEVGARDAIIDILGAVTGLDLLGVDAVYSSPLILGTGQVRAAHGLLPVPAPATVLLTRGYPIRHTDIEAELTTPTGAAILTTLSRGMLTGAVWAVERTGFGAGTLELPGVPNLLRVMIGDYTPACAGDVAILLETNIDDMNPEIFPYVLERLLERGALDAFVVPVLMKKGRPGHMVSVLVEEGRVGEILPVLFRETTTIGVRSTPVRRYKADRTAVSVETPFGTVQMKRISCQGETRLVPEFEECRRIAETHRVPLREVYARLQQVTE